MADSLVTADALQAYCTQLLVALGVPETDADLVAGTLVEADLPACTRTGPTSCRST